VFKRYPLIRQHDQSDCGAAALATVCLYHRRPMGLQQMRDLAGTDRVGTNMLGLVQAAEQVGFSATGVKGSYDSILEVGPPLPVIAHVQTDEGLGHFVVVYRVSKRSVLVADPAGGVGKMSREAFCKKWTGYLILLEPHQGPAKVQGQETLAPSQRFLNLLLCHRSVLIETLLCALLMTLLGLCSSFFIQHLVDSILVRNETALLNALGIGMLFVVLFRTGFSVLRGYLLAHVGRKVDLVLLAGYARHVIGLPLKFFEMRRVGEILSRGQDAVKVREAISGTTLTALLDGVMVVVSLAVLWCYDFKLAAVATAFVPPLIASVIFHHPAAKRQSRKAMEEVAQFSAHMVEDVSGVETIKAFGVQWLRSEERESRLIKLLGSVYRLEKLGISLRSTGLLITGFAGIVILWYGGYRVMEGALTIGQLMFFYTMLTYLLGPLERLASVNLSFQDALVAVSRLYEIMDMELEKLSDPTKAVFETVQESIEFRDVYFRYGCREDVLQGLNMKIPKGATVAIVGESGSGKSTLLKLLLRFYDPTEGTLLLDGLDFQDYNLDSLRAGIGLVSQDPYIFNATVYKNIALGNPDASMQDVVQAARTAGLDDYIAGLSERYETVIGERGANLSGGQRQRLAIARALLCQPQILLFDEATSHLDTATERAIQESLKLAFALKTVILVAHRLSTVKQADVIFVLGEGKVIEQGSHAQLLAQDGQYARLWYAQTDSPSHVEGKDQATENQT